MTKTLAELEQLATDCMESNEPGIVNRHRRAGAREGGPSWNRSEEARELLAAVALHDCLTGAVELTTAELLLAAAMIAARANGDELELGRREPRQLEQAGGELATILEDAITQHIYEEEPEDCPERKALEDWQLAKRGELELAPIRVLVALEGGLVQGAVADRPRVSVITLDYDTEGADPDEVFAIPQDDGGTAEATRGGVSVSHDPAWIDAAENAELADPEAAIELLRANAAKWDREYPTLAADARLEADELEAKLAAEEKEEAEAVA